MGCGESAASCSSGPPVWSLGGKVRGKNSQNHEIFHPESPKPSSPNPAVQTQHPTPNTQTIEAENSKTLQRLFALTATETLRSPLLFGGLWLPVTWDISRTKSGGLRKYLIPRVLRPSS